MDVNQALPLLGGLTPAQFMRRHWQKKPLLVRRALLGFEPVLDRAALFRLAGREEVEARLIVQKGEGWHMRKGPFLPRSLPPASRPGWTLLLQGVDMHDENAHRLLQLFRFVPDARLDDLMISYASTGGGVGPHFDSYDVFLLQASGRRCWRIGKQKDLTLQRDVPLKILQDFQPQKEYVLEAGDMLYLPPRYAHEGIAEAAFDGKGKPLDCMTYSIGFRAPARQELSAELLHRLAEFGEDEADAQSAVDNQADIDPIPARRRTQRAQSLYRDPGQEATSTPAAVPASLAEFASAAVMEALQDPMAVACALGEYLTALKPTVWFQEVLDPWDPLCAEGLGLDGRTRMMYDAHHVFINGESYRAKGADARLMQRLANQRRLGPQEMAKASTDALDLLAQWHNAGWIVAMEPVQKLSSERPE
jgi:50S ribosomal protein L16 3-hydroxylase